MALKPDTGLSRRKAAATALRLGLWLLFPFAVLWALICLVVGLSYGVSLFQLDNLWPTVLWFLVLALPIWIFRSLRSAADDWRRPAITLLGTLAFVTFFALTQVK